MNAPRAGQPAQPSDLVDVAALVTSLATSTSRAVAQAGSDSPWVSRPMNSGPSKP